MAKLYDPFEDELGGLPYEDLAPAVSAVLAGVWGALDGQMASTVHATLSVTMAGVWGALDGQLVAVVIPRIEAALDGTWGGLDGQMAAVIHTTVPAVLSGAWGLFDGQMTATVIPKIDAVLAGVWGSLDGQMIATILPIHEAVLAGVWGGLTAHMHAVHSTPPTAPMQWQFDDGSGWLDIFGETGPTIDISGYPPGTCFRLVETFVRNNCTVVSTSDPMCIPIEGMHAVWGNLDMQMYATRVGVYSPFQWQVNEGSGWINLPGETDSSLNVPPGSQGVCFRLVETVREGDCTVIAISDPICVPDEVSGMTGPYVMYDTRLWDGHINLEFQAKPFFGAEEYGWVDGVEQLGRDGLNEVIWVIPPTARHGLPNLGSAGDDYDLMTYMEHVGASFEFVILSAYSLFHTASAPQTLLYDDIGGPPDTGAITVVVATREPNVDNSSSESMFSFSGVGVSTDDVYRTQTLIHPPPWSANGSTSISMEVDDDAGGFTYATYTNTAAGTYPDDQVDVVWVTTLDVATNTAYIWRNGVDMTGSPAWDDSGLAALAALGNPLMAIQTFFGRSFEDYPPPGGYVYPDPLGPTAGWGPGEWPRGVYAAGIYRGVPNPSDLAALQTAYG